jgi:heavy metal sensor kinase
MNELRRRLTRTPIRARLTLWFVGVMGGALVALSLFLTTQFHRSLMNSIDVGLQIAATQILSSVELDNERLMFADAEILGASQLSFSGFAMRLVDLSGTVLDQRGNPGDQPAWGPPIAGYRTASRAGDDTQWRTLTEAVRSADGKIAGWLQVTQALDILTSTQQDIRDQLVFIIPFLLLFVGAGGYFLAYRALRPIDRITRAAETISGGDLSKRIAFEGPLDEVGRLASTFDSMLDRLQSTFDRERRFSADAAHELRTPLSVLKGRLEVTLSLDRSSEEYRAALQGLRSEVERLISVSNDLLMLSRLEQGKMETDPSPINLTDIIESVLDQYRPLAAKKQVGMTVHLLPDIEMHGNSDHILRLFLNLIDNGVKYATPGGRIELTGSVQAGCVHIELFNSTQDLTEDEANRLFERFYRADPSRSRRSGGAGLGLSIAQEIVHAHGGEIRAERLRGEGLLFLVDLPVRQD